MEPAAWPQLHRNVVRIWARWIIAPEQGPLNLDDGLGLSQASSLGWSDWQRLWCLSMQIPLERPMPV